MDAPEPFRIESRLQLFQRAIVGRAFRVARKNGDDPVLDGGIHQFVAVDDGQPLLILEQQLDRRGSLRGFQPVEQRFDALGPSLVRFQGLPRPRHRLAHTDLVERFQQVVHRVDFKRLHRVLIIGGRENDVRQPNFLAHQFFDQPETVQARHLHVEEDQVRRSLLDQIERFQAVAGLANHVHFRNAFQKISQFVARRLFVVYDESGDLPFHLCHPAPRTAGGIAPDREKLSIVGAGGERQLRIESRNPGCRH